MSRRKRPQPEHGSPHEQHLRDIVDELVQEESQKAAYLAFAHELAAVQRRAYTVHRVIPTKRSAGRNLAAKQAGRDPSSDLGVTGTTMRHRRFPDYSMETKRIVAKWFERGLSGHLMWLIGEAILRGS